MLEDTLWIIGLLSDADQVTKNPSLENSSFTLQEAVNKYKEYMVYWTKRKFEKHVSEVKRLNKMLLVTKKTVCRNKIISEIKKLNNAHTPVGGMSVHMNPIGRGLTFQL